MNTVFTADGHVDHLAAAKRRGFATLEEYQEWYADWWCSKVGKNTLVWCLGDMAIHNDGLLFLKRLPGHKRLVIGNHDKERGNDDRDLLEVFESLEGFYKHPKSPLYLSHCPSHPSQLRGRLNVHGHVHRDSIHDERYINVSIDVTPNGPVSIEDIVSGKYRSYRRVENGHVLVPSCQV